MPTDANTPADGYEEFASVFDELTDKEDNNDTNTETDPKDGSDLPENNAQLENEPADGAGDPAQPAAPGTDPAAGDGEGAQDGAGTDPAGGEQGAQNVDWQAKFADLEARFNAQQTAAPAPTPAPAPAPAPAAEPEIYSAEERTELETLQREWPDLHRLFSLMSRQVQVDTLKYAFSEVGKVLTPLQESVNTYTTNDHMAAIYEAHEDYDAAYQPCMDWIEKQPSFLKAAYQGVVKQGTAEEVSTMIQRFKDETKWQAAAAAPAGKPTTPKAAASAPSQPAGLSEAAKKAAQAMGAVGTKRSAAANSVDPNDFDGAWEEALASDN